MMLDCEAAGCSSLPFINNAKHSTFLNRVTCDERCMTSLKHKCAGVQLVETLNKFLSSPDSPAKITSPAKKLNFYKKLTPACDGKCFTEPLIPPYNPEEFQPDVVNDEEVDRA